MQLEQLKTDFSYNLGLLEERDAELDKYDTEHSILSANLADKDKQLEELHHLYAEAQQGETASIWE